MFVVLYKIVLAFSPYKLWSHISLRPQNVVAVPHLQHDLVQEDAANCRSDSIVLLICYMQCQRQKIRFFFKFQMKKIIFTDPSSIIIFHFKNTKKKEV